MATCCIPYAICPSVLKLPLATSVPYGNPAAPTTADGIKAQQVLCLPATCERLQSKLSSSRQLRGAGSEPVSAAQEVPKIPTSPSFRRVGAYRARTRREGRGESSIILVSREEPHLVSHAEVSLSLLALHPRSASCARASGAEKPGDPNPGRAARRSHPPLLPSPLPPPKQSPAPGPGYVTCPALPAPRSPHPLLARLVRVPLPGTHKVAAPGRLNPPLPSCWGERGRRGKWKRGGWAQGNLLVKLKKKKKKKKVEAAGFGGWRGVSRPGARRGRLPFGGSRAGGRGGQGAAARPPPPTPSGGGSCTHRSPLSPAPGAQPRGLGPAAKRVSGPVSRAGLRDASAASSINNPPPGGSGGFPVTPGQGAGGGGREETIKPPARLPGLPPPSPRRPGPFPPRSAFPAPARPVLSAARGWEGPREPSPRV
ncbi:basic proline-rich protein-like [Mustela erminea]|uniref:basic proline-rich protein-like n=1 Tax=Mustela erminea TaxID=36723 RepID=UPI001386643F|nr:basic proline-rich protein-like [Mustela erminea]